MAYIIAEIGSNHNGNYGQAERLIDAAADCGADAVKFQSWTPTSLWAESYLEEHPEIFEQAEQYYLPLNELKGLQKYAKAQGLDFICSVFSEDEVNELAPVLDFIKVASMDVDNLRLLKCIARHKKPVIMSCGMATDDTIVRSYNILNKSGRPVTLLHCVSLYPPEDTQVNLTRMNTLRLYAKNVGYSDHTKGITIALAAVALGAKVIEKHFTLDRSQEGWDHAVSAHPAQMKVLVQHAKQIENALLPSPVLSDIEQRKVMRRSIIASCNIEKGELITEDHIRFARPGTGIPIDKMGWVVGKTANELIRKGELISLDSLQK